MLDKQLAELLVQIGLERNADVDTIASELSTLRLPSFVDAESFRATLFSAIEIQLRRQTDERIRKLRDQLAMPAGAEAAPSAPEPQGRVTIPPEPASVPTPPEPPAAPVADQFQTIVEPASMPKDATMIWKSRPEQG